MVVRSFLDDVARGLHNPLGYLCSIACGRGISFLITTALIGKNHSQLQEVLGFGSLKHNLPARPQESRLYRI
jgi:hypothetical protein